MTSIFPRGKIQAIYFAKWQKNDFNFSQGKNSSQKSTTSGNHALMGWLSGNENQIARFKYFERLQSVVVAAADIRYEH